MLIPIGYWNNKRSSENRFIWPQELVQKDITDDMASLASYLSKGSEAIHWMGYSSCRICGLTLGVSCLTDGVYIWPEKLEHYILEHKISLPIDFLQHAQKNKWKVEKTNYNGLYDGKIKWGYWINWCKKNRNSQLEPKFEYEKYNLPTKTGDGVLTPAIMSAMFGAIENQDVIVDVIQMDNRELPKEIVDFDKRGNEYFWSAKVKRSFPLIMSMSKEYMICSALAFETPSKPVIYCSHKDALFYRCNFPLRFCPSLEESVYGEKFEYLVHRPISRSGKK